jgi:hypothetical protein
VRDPVEKGQNQGGGCLSSITQRPTPTRYAQIALNANAEIARRRYAINAVRAAEIEVQTAQDRLDARSKDEAPPGADSGSVESLAGQADFKIAWDAALPEQFELREEAVLRADLAQLSDALKALDRQMAEKLATQKRLNNEHRFPKQADGDFEPARLDPAAGDRPQRGTKIDLITPGRLENRKPRSRPTKVSLIETDAAIRSVRSVKRPRPVPSSSPTTENRLS